MANKGKVARPLRGLQKPRKCPSNKNGITLTWTHYGSRIGVVSKFPNGLPLRSCLLQNTLCSCYDIDYLSRSCGFPGPQIEQCPQAQSKAGDRHLKDLAPMKRAYRELYRTTINTASAHQINTASDSHRCARPPTMDQAQSKIFAGTSPFAGNSFLIGQSWIVSSSWSMRYFFHAYCST